MMINIIHLCVMKSLYKSTCSVIVSGFCIMKTQEHTRQVQDNVVEKFKAGFGYKTLFYDFTYFKHPKEPCARDHIVMEGGSDHCKSTKTRTSL
ncbi:hypothetical protein GDO81_028930 [Engystomops pustulosus]|uniref:Uncharacterized protein n=1 Tax=Engystomops pustulosus TaxID=76066 RepID=A0AAV6YCK9_ENGPU|nr:hypothetical protein GDO81_028930 [Engystomops pustulosus]